MMDYEINKILKYIRKIVGVVLVILGLYFIMLFPLGGWELVLLFFGSYILKGKVDEKKL